MEDTSAWVLLLSFALFFSFFLLVFVFWYSWWYTRRIITVSPYTGLPLRYATDLSYYSREKIWRYLNDLQQYDNRPFEFNRASFCRETGRIFPNSVTWIDTVRVDWTFLNKRYPGIYVSWGSLNNDQQKAIRDAHETLEGFQTELSCPEPLPQAITPEYVYTVPGPLYVDINTMVLLGWKKVPDTDLEVLIVQKPIKREIP